MNRPVAVQQEIDDILATPYWPSYLDGKIEREYDEAHKPKPRNVIVVDKWVPSREQRNKGL